MNETIMEADESKSVQARSTKSTLVTVVIPTYNRARFIRKAIRSVLKQTISNWRMLIVDDGSTDDTAKVVGGYLTDPRIKYVRLKRNRGVCYTLNYALSLVRTTYMVQLDADDWYEPSTLETCLRAMKKAANNVAVVYGDEKIWRLNDNGTIKFMEYKKKRQLRGKYDFITFRPMIYPRFYRTAALRKVGGWSTKVPQGGRFAEDRQILLKLAGHYRFQATGTTLYNRLRHKNNNSRRENKKLYASVTRYLYTKALVRWGNRYRAKFIWVNGRLKVGRLIKK